MTRRTPQAVKKLHGTTRRDRALPPPAATPVADVVQPPATLSAAARAEWEALAPAALALRTLDATSTRAFGLLCEALAAAETARAEIATAGTTLPTEGGGQKANPLLRLMEAAENRAFRLLSAFGLTPAGRAAMDLQPATSLPQPTIAGIPNDDHRRNVLSLDAYLAAAPPIPVWRPDRKH